MTAVRFSRRAFLAVAPLPFLAGCKKPSPLRIAAASDLTQVLPIILENLPGEGPAPVVTYGATGKLTQQIENGAPFDVFLAAHERYLVQLEGKGHLLAGTRKSFALGRLSVVAKAPCPNALTVADLAQERFKRIAIANPDHAPYGAAAREALEKAGVAASLGARLVLADNVQTALVFVRTGNADAAIVARSLLTADESCATAVDPSLHAPIVQAGAVLRTATDPARAKQIVDWMVDPKVHALLVRGGFALPGAP